MAYVKNPFIFHKLILSTFFLLSLISLFPEISGRQSDKLFPYGLDERDSTLPRDNDDISSPEFRVTVPIVLYGQQFSSGYVSDFKKNTCRQKLKFKQSRNLHFL